MSNALTEFSNHLAAAVEHAAASVVTVHGRPRVPSSGIVWRPGLVLTADAALRRDEDIRVTLPTGATVGATVQGRDPGTDLALLACDTASVTAVQFSQSSPKAGQIVLTVGRTADTGPIATMGIISGVSGEWRTWRGGSLEQFVRLDASVYPTSSGGAVVDTQGTVIGLVAAGLSRSSVIAVTRSTLERVAGVLSTQGHVPRAYLGVGLQPVAIPQALRQHLDLKQESGVMLLHVAEDGPAGHAGMLMGDVLLSLGSKHTETPEDLQEVLDREGVNKSLPAQVLRAGTLHHLNVTIGERQRSGV